MPATTHTIVHIDTGETIVIATADAETPDACACSVSRLR